MNIPYHSEPSAANIFTGRKTGAGLRPLLLSAALVLSLCLPLCFPLRASAAVSESPAEKEQTAGDQATERQVAADQTEKNWSEDYYRANDDTGGLSAEELKELDRLCLEFVQTRQADLSLLALSSGSYGNFDAAAYARAYYEKAGFGYGPDKKGFQMIWDTDTDQVLIEAYGGAGDLIPVSYLKYAADHVAQYREEYGNFGPFYATVRYLSTYLDNREEEKTAAAVPGETLTGAGRDLEAGEGTDSQDSPAGTESGTSPEAEDPVLVSSAGTDNPRAARAETDKSRLLPEGTYPDDSLRVGEGSDLPAWYPKEPSTFPFYHDAKAPRVVDQADLFTDEEEALMEDRLAELRTKLAKDIVVFTDVSTHGLTHMDYSESFFDFNGYGLGDDFEGVCLMICMDPADRGWWTSCTGPVTMGLYTEDIANEIDDMLYPFMVDGNYYDGVSDWIENFRRLYITGSPYDEEWAIQDKETFTRFHDPDAPRVVDDARILTEEETENLARKARTLSEKYNTDIVIHTSASPGSLDRADYGELYYYTHGYGLGEDYDGIQLTIFKHQNYSYGAHVYASGGALDKLTSVNKERLEDRCNDLTGEEKYYRAASAWLDQTEHMLRTGRAPLSARSWAMIVAFSLAAGIIFGAFSLARAALRMETPKMKENADAYLVRGSLRIINIEDTKINTTVHRQYSPPPKASSSSRSSSGSGGRSSYSGSHSGSSGRTHSGSGRKF